MVNWPILLWFSPISIYLSPKAIVPRAQNLSISLPTCCCYCLFYHDLCAYSTACLGAYISCLPRQAFPFCSQKWPHFAKWLLLVELMEPLFPQPTAAFRERELSRWAQPTAAFQEWARLNPPAHPNSLNDALSSLAIRCFWVTTRSSGTVLCLSRWNATIFRLSQHRGCASSHFLLPRL